MNFGFLRRLLERTPGTDPRGRRVTNPVRPVLPAAEVAEILRRATRFRPSREYLAALDLREATPDLTFDPEARELLREGTRRGCVYSGVAAAESVPRADWPDGSHPGVRAAAAAGFPPALLVVGSAALDRGAREEGLRVLRRAAELGSGDAATCLGMRFQFGEGVPLDERGAFRWYLTAAEADHPVGARIAGLCRLSGTGCDRDDAAGERLLERAAARGDAAAHWHLADVAAGAARRDLHWISDLYAAPRAAAHLETGARLGHRLSQVWVAQARLAGLKPAVPEGVMFGWLIRGGATWDRRADFLASGFLEYGIGVERDDLRAFELCLRAAKFGEARAARRLTEFYEVRCEFSADAESA